MFTAATDLERYAWLSVAAAIVTIALKTLAWRLTGSVGLLSDALESIVNLAAALLALTMLRVAASPPDENHPYGFSRPSTSRPVSRARSSCSRRPGSWRAPSPG
jgi:divalent metal cation (Fe/Co/Zn/Cd) transporter